MKNPFEGDYLFSLYLKYESERLFKLEILLMCIKMYTNLNNNLLALPSPSDDSKQNKQDFPKSEVPSEETESTEEVKDSKGQDSTEQRSKNNILKNLEQLLQSKEEQETGELVIEEKPHIEPNAIIIKNLISKFLKLYFKYKESNLNFRARNEVDKVYGYYYWDKKQVARHLVTKDFSKILSDKYDVQYGPGSSENIPLALYFDLSESMERYSSIMADIALALLKNNVRVLIGYNSTVQYQINSINIKTTSADLKKFFSCKSHDHIDSEKLYEDLDKYLSRKKCERCIVVSDHDSYYSVCNLSKICEVYLLYCLNYRQKVDDNFKGAYFEIKNDNDLMNALLEMSKYNYSVLKAKNRIRKRSR